MPSRTRAASKNLIDESSENTLVMEKSKSKTPKGKQSLSEKRVSFQIGKQQVKTPRKSTSSVANVTPSSIKKAPILKSKPAKKATNTKSTLKDSDESESDDDEDDDEFDMDSDDFLDIGDDTDDDDFDDDDDDESLEDEDDSDDVPEDEDQNLKKNIKQEVKKTPSKQKKGMEKNVSLKVEEDSDHETEISKKSKKNISEAVKQKTPSKQKKGTEKNVKTEFKEDEDSDNENKSNKKSKENISNAVKQKTPLKQKDKKLKKSANEETGDIKEDPELAKKSKTYRLSKDVKNKLMKADLERRAKRRSRLQKLSLLVKRLPANATVDNVKKLSADIVAVWRTRSMKKMGAAFLHFASEDLALKNLKSLETIKMNNKPIKVTVPNPKPMDELKKSSPDFKRLQVMDLPSTARIADVAPCFPQASQIEITDDVGCREAIITLASPKEGKEAFYNTAAVEIKGRSFDVVFCPYKLQRPKKSQAGGKPPKQQKTSK